MAWGLEARVPFLDKAFLDAAMNVDPKDKQFSKGTSQGTDEDGCPKMEKYILRKAFDVSPDGKVNTHTSLPPLGTHSLWKCCSHISRNRFSGARRSSFLTALGIRG